MPPSPGFSRILKWETVWPIIEKSYSLGVGPEASGDAEGLSGSRGYSEFGLKPAERSGSADGGNRQVRFRSLAWTGFPKPDLGRLGMSVHIRWEKVNENIRYFTTPDSVSHNVLHNSTRSQRPRVIILGYTNKKPHPKRHGAWQSCSRISPENKSLRVCTKSPAIYKSTHRSTIPLQ